MDQLERRAPAAAERQADEQRPSGRRRWPGRWPWPWIAGAAAVILLSLVFVATRGSSTPETLSPAQISSTVQSLVQEGIADAANAPPESVGVYQTILPSLVVIEAEHAASAGAPTQNHDEAGLGTGVIVSDEGAILTARHVIAGASSIKVTFADGTSTTAQVAQEEPENDIAVLAAADSPATLVPATLGGGVQIGDTAYAVGNPLALSASLSAGVISGLNRSISVQGGPTLKGLIQFDAAVNPGSSGGPLLNRNGQVVGIVTALANPSQQGFFIGIGFAVPISTAAGGAGAPPQ